jgi:hypothetical protein
MSDDIYKDPLISKMWQTKGSRFIAYARLQRKHRLSLFTISLLSMYITAISVLLLSPNNFHLGVSPEALSLIAVIASLFLVVLAQHENSKNYLVRADHMHTCALEILSLYTKLEAKLGLAIDQKKTADEIYEIKEPFINNYNNILMKYPENHDEVDYKLFCSDNPNVFKNYSGCIAQCKLKVLAWLNDRWLYFLIMIIPLIFFVFAAAPTFNLEKDLSKQSVAQLSVAIEEPQENTETSP